MSSFGVTDDGFNLKLIGDILDEIEAQQQTDFGSTINTGAESVLGQLNATFAAGLAEAWEVLQAVYRSLYPDSATGEALDNVAAITGVTREPATRSTINLTCAGTAGTALLAGRVVSVDATGERFVSVGDAAIPGGGSVDVLFQSENYGPIALQTDQELTIETPVAGWSSATAGEDAELGENLETDAELRLRRADLLRFQGVATIEAIRADVLDVDGVEQAFVYENVSSVTDGRSVPPKSIEVIVEGGDDDEIGAAIFETKCAGIDSYGHPPNNVTSFVQDSQGITHAIKFTRPDTIRIYQRADITYDPAIYTPATDDALVREALAALGDGLRLGENIIYERFQAEVFSIPGVVDCPLFRIDTVTPPVGTSNITFTTRELATFDTGDVTINSSSI